VLHKAIERRRTRKINDLIEGIKAEMEVLQIHILPLLPSYRHACYMYSSLYITVYLFALNSQNHNRFVKKDKASILAAALTYIQDLQSDITTLKRERTSLILQARSGQIMGGVGGGKVVAPLPVTSLSDIDFIYESEKGSTGGGDILEIASAL
jgi:hypothetical protein